MSRDGSATRERLVAANWKMHKTVAEAQSFMGEFLALISGHRVAEIAICPAFTCLAALRDLVRDNYIRLGAQDVFWELSGAYTGEISATMLLDLGCQFVIIGHSERRHILGETEQAIHRKLTTALAAGLTPIFCIGETLEQREKGLAREIVGQQLAKGLGELVPLSLVIAYEPVWAIGTGVNATPADAQEMIGFIRAALARKCGPDLAARARILYGGSVKADNISRFMEQPDIDGALVGGASLAAAEFASIVRSIEDA